jgi:hypothetical protein
LPCLGGRRNPKRFTGQSAGEQINFADNGNSLLTPAE